MCKEMWGISRVLNYDRNAEVIGGSVENRVFVKSDQIPNGAII